MRVSGGAVNYTCAANYRNVNSLLVYINDKVARVTYYY